MESLSENNFTIGSGHFMEGDYENMEDYGGIESGAMARSDHEGQKSDSFYQESPGALSEVGNEVMSIDNSERREKNQEDKNEDDHDQEEDQDAEETETAAAERKIEEYRISATRDVAANLEKTLNRVKTTTKTMLNEIEAFMRATESVTVDYLRCQASQHNESQRLEEVEPDVAGATTQFLQQAQILMMGAER